MVRSTSRQFGWFWGWGLFLILTCLMFMSWHKPVWGTGGPEAESTPPQANDERVIALDLENPEVKNDSKRDPGGCVVLNADGNNAPRREIQLKAPKYEGNGHLVLSRIQQAEKGQVRVFDQAQGGQEITFNGVDNVFDAQTIKTQPKSLFVEGSQKSGTMKDVELKLTAVDLNPQETDSVNFTVLWVQTASRHNGQMSADNNAIAAFDLLSVPPNHNLGVPILSATFNLPGGSGGASYGLASEFVGTVSPSDFVPAVFSATEVGPTELKLERDRLGGDEYWGPNGNENHLAKPAGPDTSFDYFRDDDPQSNGSAGKIYDLDGPGITANLAPFGGKWRTRVNYKEYATWTIKNAAGQQVARVRCSNELPWYTRQSYVCQGIEEGQATGGGPQAVQDTTKNWQANQWVPGVLETHFPANTQFRHIRKNDVNTVFVTVNFNPAIVLNTPYAIFIPTTWVPVNDVPGDNKNDDGETKTTWNLQ